MLHDFGVKNTSDQLTTIKKQFGHIQRIPCLGMTGCMSTTPTAYSISNGDPPGSTTLQLVVEKEARQAAYKLHCSNHFKNQTGDILLFSRWQ
jgi:hypothetical protein